jgi:glutamine cyclotransferase
MRSSIRRVVQNMSALLPPKRAVRSLLSVISRWHVPRVEPVILRTLPHDADAFTQGLAYLNGDLYESSGKQPHSSLRRLDIRNGSTKKAISIRNDFAEGIAIQDNLLYMLSWKSGTARVFQAASMELVRELHYQGEGWGLCSGRSVFVMSNGTGTLQFVDRDFCVLRRLRVTINRFPVRRLNDLEWVDDSIYANVFLSDNILEVSAKHGCVTRIVDCSRLTALAAPIDVEHTLNGIAYNPDTGTFFVTGKCWKVMFEVDFRSGETSVT